MNGMNDWDLHDSDARGAYPSHGVPRDQAALMKAILEGERKGKQLQLSRVCLIDDDEIFCRKLARLARSEAMTVDWFNSFGEFHQAIRQPWDLILLDLYLGSADGLAIAKWMASNHQSSPILLVSSKEDFSPRQSEWSSNIIGFAEKAQDLRAIINLLHMFSTHGRDQSPIPSSCFGQPVLV